ncbi:MAG: hypothetical protein ACREJ2_09515 [Planctomycetota bacterium]
MAQAIEGEIEVRMLARWYANDRERGKRRPSCLVFYDFGCAEMVIAAVLTGVLTFFLLGSHLGQCILLGFIFGIIPIAVYLTNLLEKAVFRHQQRQITDEMRRANSLRLFEIYSQENDENLFEKADLARELGRFEEAAMLLERISERDMNTATRTRFRSWLAHRDTKTHPLA